MYIGSRTLSSVSQKISFQLMLKSLPVRRISSISYTFSRRAPSLHRIPLHLKLSKVSLMKNETTSAQKLPTSGGSQNNSTSLQLFVPLGLQSSKKFPISVAALVFDMFISLTLGVGIKLDLMVQFYLSQENLGQAQNLKKILSWLGQLTPPRTLLRHYGMYMFFLLTNSFY